MPVVVDASVALAWALPDEGSAYADLVLSIADAEGVMVPDLWPREVANGLAMAFNRGRLTVEDEESFLTALAELSIEVDHGAPLDIIRGGVALAQQYGLTAYDAAYVEVAERERLPLATLDRRMGDAALRAGVRVTPRI